MRYSNTSSSVNVVKSTVSTSAVAAAAAGNRSRSLHSAVSCRGTCATAADLDGATFCCCCCCCCCISCCCFRACSAASAARSARPKLAGDSEMASVSTNEMPKNPKKYAKHVLHSTMMGKNMLVNGDTDESTCDVNMAR